MIKFLYKNFLKKIYFRLDPEFVHDRIILLGNLLGKFAFGRKLTLLLFNYQNAALAQKIAGITFNNPVGLSAGFDKDGKLLDILSSVGFGYTQVGTVTYNSYEGNPRPRLTRLIKSKGIIVYYGLKNEGVRIISKRILSRKVKNLPISISVGKTNASYTKEAGKGIKDYVDCLEVLEKNHVGDIYTINISCPNTFGGEPFTDPKSLTRLLENIKKLNIQKPVFIKMPLLEKWTEFKKLLDVASKYKFINGVIISNLIKDRKSASLHPDENTLAEKTKGSISGKPMEKQSTQLIRETYKAYGKRFVIVGVGGIFSAEDAYEKIKAGASLVQLITGMIFEGPTLINEINYGLVELLKKDGYENISEAIGKNI